MLANYKIYYLRKRKRERNLLQQFKNCFTFCKSNIHLMFRWFLSKAKHSLEHFGFYVDQLDTRYRLNAYKTSIRRQRRRRWKGVLKILRTSWEDTCVGVSFSTKLQTFYSPLGQLTVDFLFSDYFENSRPGTLSKKRLRHRCFLANVA